MKFIEDCQALREYADNSLTIPLCVSSDTGINKGVQGCHCMGLSWLGLSHSMCLNTELRYPTSREQGLSRRRLLSV